MDQFVSLISNVGFPIVAVYWMAKFLNKNREDINDLNRQHREEIKELTSQHTQEMNAMSLCLQNNTNAIDKLSEKIGAM